MRTLDECFLWLAKVGGSVYIEAHPTQPQAVMVTVLDRSASADGTPEGATTITSLIDLSHAGQHKASCMDVLVSDMIFRLRKHIESGGKSEQP